MIPILFSATETNFNTNGIGRLRSCTRCEVVEERNSIYEVEFDYPVDGVHFADIILGSIICASHDDSGDLQPFDIYASTKPIDGVVTFRGQHISYRQKYMYATLNSASSLSNAFGQIKSAYPSNPFNYITDMTVSRNLPIADGIPRTVREIMGGSEGSILDTYGGEYLFDKWNVYLLSQRGKKKPVTIRYGVNMLEFSEDLDFSETYNAVVPYWKGDDGEGGQTVIIGQPVLSSESSYDGRTRCVPLDLSDSSETQPTLETLEMFARGYLANNSPTLPNRNIKIDFIQLSESDEYSMFSELQKCQLCDYVTVAIPFYNMTGDFKIVRVVWDVLQERYTEMELGNLSTSLAEALGIK